MTLAKVKRFIIALLIVVLVGFMTPIGSFNVMAKAKPKLSKKKITIFVGQKKKLKVKHKPNKAKVKWISSKKKIVSVSKKGVVRGKKAGKATIAAIVKGKIYKCKVIVKKTNGYNTNPTNDTAANVDPMTKYTKNFDAIVDHIKKNGVIESSYVTTYGYVQYVKQDQAIKIYTEDGIYGHYVSLYRGKYEAFASVSVRGGRVKSYFDIRNYRGDGTDSFNWDGTGNLLGDITISPSVVYTYNAAIANVLKNISQNNFYIGGYTLKDIGFEAYLY